MTAKRKPAATKPTARAKRAVAKEPFPYPGTSADAEREFELLQKAVRDGERAKKAEAEAKSLKDANFADAKILAERLRLYVEANGITPGFNANTLAFTAGRYAMEESPRESAFLVADARTFIAEARKQGTYNLFVRVKEEPNFVAFLLGDNRLKASKFRCANIEHERSIEIRPIGTEARLRYVLNEREPKWEVAFPKK